MSFDRYELTRVSIFLPITLTNTHIIDKIITELKTEFRGVTHSVASPTVFKGWWVELTGDPTTGTVSKLKLK